MADNNPIYKFLKDNGLTSKSEADFIKEYSSDANKQKELYKFMKDNELTSKDELSFVGEYFPKQAEVPALGSAGTSLMSEEPIAQDPSTEGILQNQIGSSSDQSSDFIAKLNQRNIQANNLQGLDENLAMQEFAIPEGTEVIDNRVNEYGFPVYAKKNDDGTYSEGGSILEQVDVSISRDEAIRRAGMTQDELIKSNEPIDFSTSVKNSAKNVWNQLQGADDRLSIFSADVIEKLLGSDLAKDWYAYSDRDLEKVRLDAYAELDRLGKEALPTMGIVEGFANNNMSSVAAGIINGVTSIFSTAIVSAPTLGAGLVTEMVGGSLYDYNTAKAKSLGVSTEQLIKDGKADFWTPAIVGAVGAALEKFGLKGVKDGILKELSGPMVKKMASLGLEMNKEGMTEWVQTGLEGYNEAIAEGKDVSEATKALVSKMFSDEGLESYLQGASGSGGSIAGGRLIKGIVTKASRDKISSDSERLQNVVNDLSGNNDPAVISQLLEAAGEISSDIQSERQRNNELLMGLSPEQRQEVSGVQSEIDSINNSIGSGNLSEQTVEYLNGKKDELSNKIDNIVTTVPPSYKLSAYQIDKGIELQRKANPDIANIPMGDIEISDDVFSVLSAVDARESVGESEISKAIESLYEKKKELKSLKKSPKRNHLISEIDEAIKGIDSDLETLSNYGNQEVVLDKLSNADFSVVKPGDVFEEGVVKSSKLLEDGSIEVTMEDGSVIESKPAVVDNNNIEDSTKDVSIEEETSDSVKTVDNEKVVNEKIPEPIAEINEAVRPQDKDFDVKQEQVDELNFSSPEEADMHTLRNTTDPNEVLRIYDQWENTDNSKTDFIANNLGKINANDYARVSDKGNVIGDSRLRKWIDSKNSGKVSIDVLLEDLSDRYGAEITIDDVLDFISKYDSASDYKRSKSDNNIRVEAGFIYQKLTGKNITESALRKYRERYSNESRDRERDFINKENMNSIGITEQEVSDRQNMESEADKVAIKNAVKEEGAPVTPSSLLKGISKKLKDSGLANSVRLENTESITNDLGVDGSNINGYVDEKGNIIINKDKAGIDTPIHEFGHIWMGKMKSDNKALFDRGMELISSNDGKVYVDYVKQTQPDLSGDALYEEALAQAIGDSGARLIKSQERSKMTEWLKAAWNYIGSLAGISERSIDDISKMTLREYSDAVAVDLLSGKSSTVVGNGDIIVSNNIISSDNKSDINVDEKKISDFIEKMRVKNGIKYQANSSGNSNSLSDADLADFVDVVQSLLKTGKIDSYSDLKDFAQGIGISNEGQIRFAWRANHPDAAIGIKKSLVDAKTILNSSFDKMSDQDYIELGKRLVDQGLININELINEVIESGRVLEPYEVTALIYSRTLDEKRIDELSLVKNPSSEVKAEIEALYAKIGDFELLILQTASAQSAAFRLRGVLTDKDYNVLYYINAMDKVGSVSAELRSELESLGKEMEDVKSQLRNKISELQKLHNSQSQSNINKTSSKKSPSGNLSNSRRAEAKRDALSVIDDIDINDYGNPAMSFQKNGIKFSVNSSNPLLSAIQNGLSSIRDSLSNGKSLDVSIESAIDQINAAVGEGNWNEIKFRSDILNKYISKGHSPEAKKPYVGSDGKIVVPTSYLKDIVVEYRKANGNSEMSIEDMTSKVMGYIGSGFNKRDVMDAISRYGRAVSNTKSDEMSNINKARTIGKLIAELDDLEKTSSIKQKRGRNPISQRVKDLRRAIEALEDSITFTPEEKAQIRADKALELKKKNIEDYIKKIENKVATKDFEPETRTPLYDFSNDPDVIALEKKREEIRNKFKAAKYKHELENRTVLEKSWDIGISVFFNLMRGITAGTDLSAYLIQGGLVTLANPISSTNRLFKSVGKMWSEDKYNDYFSELQRDPFFDIARKAKLNLQLPNFYQSIVEEQVGTGNPVNKIYELAVDKIIKDILKRPGTARKWKDRAPWLAAERQYALFLSDTRFSLFKQVATDAVNYKGIDISSKEGQAELAKIADAVNDITMASNIKFLEGATRVQEAVNLFLFSARKLAANFKILYKLPYYGTVSAVNLGARLSGNNSLANKTDFDAMLFNKLYGGVAGKGLAVMAAAVVIPALISNAAYDEDEDEEPPLFYNPNVLNPIHSDFMKLRIGDTRFSPFLGIDGAVVFMSRMAFGEYMTSSSNELKEVGKKSGMTTNKTRGDLAIQFFQNKLAPAPSLAAGWMGSEFSQRESGERFPKNFMPMWMADSREEYEKNDNISWAVGTTLLSILGANFNTYGGAEFASKKGTDNKEASDIMRKAKLTDYTPTFRDKKYGVFEEGSFVESLSDKKMEKVYGPAYNEYMTQAVLANRTDLNNKSTNAETKEGLLMRLKRDAYAYAELESTGIIVDKNFITFNHVDDNGVLTKYRLTKSQYGEKIDLINKFKTSGEYDAKDIREDVIESLGVDVKNRDPKFIKMKIDLKTFSLANKWANEQLSEKFVKDKYVKDSDFTEELNEAYEK